VRTGPHREAKTISQPTSQLTTRAFASRHGHQDEPARLPPSRDGPRFILSNTATALSRSTTNIQCGVLDPTLVTPTENGGYGQHPTFRDIQNGRTPSLRSGPRGQPCGSHEPRLNYLWPESAVKGQNFIMPYLSCSNDTQQRWRISSHLLHSTTHAPS
jgi:hypothetical protein